MAEPYFHPHYGWMVPVEGLPLHDYLSTACFHSLHDRCRKTCKFCDVGCRCSCHQEVQRDEH